MPGWCQFLQLVWVASTAPWYKLQQIWLILRRGYHMTVYQPPCILQIWISNKIRSVITSCHKNLLYPVCSMLKPLLINQIITFLLRHMGPLQAMASSFMKFLDHTQQRTTAGRTPLDEWSACCKALYLTTRNTHNLSRRAVADLCLRPCGHWDQQKL